MAEPLTIATFFWQATIPYPGRVPFTVEHVERLGRGLRRHLRTPHRFVVITDRPAREFREPDAVIPLWSDYLDLGGCWVRLKAFAPAIREVLGPRFAWIDLDVVVTGELDPIFARAESFIAWRDVSGTTPYCGSLIMMDAGARAAVWEDFDPVKSPRLARHYIGDDQAWISHRLGPDEAVWTEADGIYSYRKHVQPRDGRLPAGARLVFFHGRPDPSRVEDQALAPWIQEHWR